MKLWSETLPLKIYQTYLDEEVCSLTELTDSQRAHHDGALTAYYDLVRETHPEFEIYRHTKEFQKIMVVDRSGCGKSSKEHRQEKFRSYRGSGALGYWGDSFVEFNTA